MARLDIELLHEPCPLCGVVPFPDDLDILHIDDAARGPELSFSYMLKEADTIRLLMSCLCNGGGRWWRMCVIISEDGETLEQGWVPFNAILLAEAQNNDQS